MGPFIAGIMIDAVGRKWTLLVDTVLLLIAWAVLGTAKSIWSLFLGRFLSGIALGVIFMGVPLYIAEISEVSFYFCISFFTFVLVFLLLY